MTEDFRWRLFFGNKCPSCQKAKRPRTAFCKLCFLALPVGMRGKLWLHFRQGYEAAFDQCLEFLAVKFNRERYKYGATGSTEGIRGQN